MGPNTTINGTRKSGCRKAVTEEEEPYVVNHVLKESLTTNIKTRHVSKFSELVGNAC